MPLVPTAMATRSSGHSHTSSTFPSTGQGHFEDRDGVKLTHAEFICLESQPPVFLHETSGQSLVQLWPCGRLLHLPHLPTPGTPALTPFL